MDNTDLFPRLRARLSDYMDHDQRRLVFVHKTTKIKYSRLYTFHKGKSDLPLLDADTLHIFLTGKPLITADHV